MRTLTKSLLILVFSCVLPQLAAAEPPARVGRVSLVSGTLAFYGPGDSEWSAANVNLPAATGGWFATDPRSRAQIRIGADSLNLAQDTQLNIVDLQDNLLQVALPQGRVDLHLRPATWRKDQGVQIDILRGAVWLLQPGVYDIDSGTAQKPTRIMVFEGSARFVGGGVEKIVNAGESLVLNGIEQLTAKMVKTRQDDFAKWCQAHDYRDEVVARARQVPPAVTGFEELDQYGEWTDAADYGPVWYPKSVSADWVPYRQGRWVWIDPWGWNWVDDEPWGFAPSHYGRWARIDNRWGWVPGEFTSDPVYAPALVAYLPAPEVEIGVADAGAPVGWFPLAPGELYWPSYASDPTYFRAVNVGNVPSAKIAEVVNSGPFRPGVGEPPPTVINQRFANRAAATVVPAAIMAASRPVKPAVVPVAPPALSKAHVAVAPPPTVKPPSMAAANAPGSARPGHGRPDLAAAPGQPGQAGPTALRHRPERPNFAALSPAPRVRQLAEQRHQREAAPASPPPSAQATPPQAPGRPGGPPAIAQVPGRPNFSRLAPARGHRHDIGEVARPTGQQAPQIGAPAATLPGGPGRSAPPDVAVGSTVPPGQERAAERRQELMQQRAAQAVARQQQRAQAEAQQKAATEAAATEQARQKAAAAEAARHQAEAAHQAQQQKAGARQQAQEAAQQRAAVEAAARQQRAAQQAQQATQQRAAAQAAAQQQRTQQAQQAAQQRAAAEAGQQQQAAAARQQQAAAAAQQRAAAQAAAQQQQAAARQQQAAAAAQQRAAAQAAAQQQQAAARQQQAAAAAQQRAAGQAAAQQQQAAARQQQAAAAAQQRAAAQAAAQQQQAAARQQQAAAAAAAKQQAAAQHQAHACGHPGLPPCPK